uniref:Uncharacterized protein n=1 Tax=Arundo donax TaxID=35708 RepID=A0A0A9HP27_ARUDO
MHLCQGSEFVHQKMAIVKTLTMEKEECHLLLRKQRYAPQDHM